MLMILKWKSPKNIIEEAECKILLNYPQKSIFNCFELKKKNSKWFLWTQTVFLHTQKYLYSILVDDYKT